MFFVYGCDWSQDKDQTKQTDSPVSFEQKICRQIDIALKSKQLEETRAILNGLKWCILFIADDEHFDYIFSDYLQMLAELAQNKTDPDIKRFAAQLIKEALDRAKSRLPSIFPLTPAAKWDFISIIPSVTHYFIGTKGEKYA